MSQNSDRDIDSMDNRWLNIELYVKASEPNLLIGLDEWLRLGLITEAQVIALCRQYLTCAVPEVEIAQVSSDIEVTTSIQIEKTLVESLPKPNIISQIWQAFLDELSIRWLLFLGILLVVVSSGVLAASQWNNFPRFGQYLILWGYTLSFWSIGLWLGKQENLKLTSQTISAIALMLVPINFWAISSFGLGSNILEWITVAIAFMSLTGISYLQARRNIKSNRLDFLLLFLLLSYFHLGWKINSFPILAVYLGIITIATLNYRFLLSNRNYQISNLFLLATWSLLLVRALLINEDLIVNFSLAIALFGWLLSTIYLNLERQLNLIEPENPIDSGEKIKTAFLSKVFQSISLIIIFFSWLVSLLGGLFESELFFWQTIAISCLAIHLFNQRLTIYWRKRDLTAIFLIGLQTLLVAKELIPNQLRTSALHFATEISQTEYFPESIFGVTLFPYLTLFVVVASWLYRREKFQLALYCEQLTLLLGITLTLLSLSNPTWRVLNLLFSSLTLGYVCYIRKPVRIPLIYLTHLLSLLTIVNAIAFIFPNLPEPVWGSILVLLMAIEWLISLGNATTKPVRNRNKKSTNFILLKILQSCWYFGLVLAGISYACFLFPITTTSTPSDFRIGLVWLITPVMLTVVAKYTQLIAKRRLATSLSCAALISAQFLIFGQPETRLISLVVATGLMFANVYHLRRSAVIVIHLGFALCLIANLLWGYVASWNWLIVGAIAIIVLYQFRRYLLNILDSPRLAYISQRSAWGQLGVGAEVNNFKLIGKYTQAADIWAIALITVELISFSLVYFNFANPNLLALNISWQYPLAAIFIGGAVLWRYRQQPNEIVLYTVCWLIELAVSGIIILVGGTGLVAIANIILGLSSLWLLRRLTTTSLTWGRLANLSQIPLIYASLGILWRTPYFTAYTGFLTLGAALTGIGVNQDSDNKTINYISLAGVSLAIYELVIYQLTRTSGGSAADGLTILALVAAVIAFIYRLTSWCWRKYNRQSIVNIRIKNIIVVAHIHWAISSILKIIAAGIAVETATPRLTPISIAVSFCLGAYAIIQGKDAQTDSDGVTTNSAKDWWVYVGLVEIAATLVYSRLILSKLSLFDPWRVIFTCAVALAIYQIPWHNFGWRSTPWQRTALIIPALMALVTAEDISYLSLLVTAVFYLRIAYHQRNLRWSYLSLGFIDWGITRLVWQFNTEFIWLAGIIGLSILYVAQFDPQVRSNKKQRYYLRLVGSIVICIVALFYQNTGLVPSLISLVIILAGLGLKIRAFLFVGTITFILTIIYQLVILVFTYSFLKWIVGLIAGIVSIVVAANFESKRDRLTNQLQTYVDKLQQWQ